MEKISGQKHFVCQSTTCNNRCNNQDAIHCNGACNRHHFGYGKSYKCEKCGNVRRRRNGHRVYTCGKCNHLYCYSCCFRSK